MIDLARLARTCSPIVVIVTLSLAVSACSTGSQAKESESTPRPKVPTAEATATRSPTPKPVYPTAVLPEELLNPGGLKTPGPASASAGGGGTAGIQYWSTEVLGGRGTFRPGTVSSISIGVLSTTALNALVEVEIDGPDGGRVYQTSANSVAFKPNVKRTFDVTWPIKATAVPGDYTVKIGVFSVGYGELYNWNDKAWVYHITR